MRWFGLVAVFCVLVLGCGEQTPARNQSFVVDVSEATIADLQAAMARGELTAVALTQAYMARIERGNPTLNAVLEINPDALTIAGQLDRERAEGHVRSSLHGIPVLIKDNIDTADKMLTTAGSLALVDAPAPQRDAFVVQRLRAAGAIILGKTNLSEWANFRSSKSSSGWSARGGQTRNPYALEHTPCGSSSGSAVAVAANLTVVAIGTETDGSIVCPAGNNAIVGIKPTVGLVSRAGIIPIAPSQDTAGPMARTVTDAALLLTIIAGRDVNDAVTASAPPAIDYSEFLDANGLRNRRIGVLRQFFGRNVETDKVIEGQLAELTAAGATLVDVEIDTLHDYGAAEFHVLLHEFRASIADYLQARGASVQTLADLIAFNRGAADVEMRYFGQDLFEQADNMAIADEETYREALQRSKQLTQDRGIDAALQRDDLDALVAPTNSAAWKIDLVNGDQPQRYVSSSSLAAVAGYPSITVPAGFVGELPIGLSFIGAAYSEPSLIAMAFAYEQQSRARRPPRFLDDM